MTDLPYLTDEERDFRGSSAGSWLLAERLSAEREKFASCKEYSDKHFFRAERAEREIERLRDEIESYLLWRPCEKGHAAAHRRLTDAFLAASPPDTEPADEG
jgi:hypothetical protein